MKKLAIIVGDITNSRGTERAVSNLANMLSNSQKYKVFLLSCFSNGTVNSYYELNDSIKVIHLNITRKTLFLRIRSYFLLIKRINALIKSESLDMVIGTTHAFNIALTFIESKIIKIGCEHMNYYACPIYSRIIRFIRYKYLSAVVVLSERDKMNYNFLEKTHNVVVIPNSLSFSCDSSATLKNKRIISVGGLSKEKGYEDLIDMSIILKEKIPDWHVDIYGNGILKEILQKRILDNKLEDYVVLQGATKEIKEKYLESSIYVLTSKYECFPMVLLEAQMCGIPVVAFDCNYGPADIINNSTDGYVIPVGNKNAFVDKVIELANDIELRKKIGFAARSNAQKFSEVSVYKQWDELLTAL